VSSFGEGIAGRYGVSGTGTLETAVRGTGSPAHGSVFVYVHVSVVVYGVVDVHELCIQLPQSFIKLPQSSCCAWMYGWRQEPRGYRRVGVEARGVEAREREGRHHSWGRQQDGGGRFVGGQSLGESLRQSFRESEGMRPPPDSPSLCSMLHAAAAAAVDRGG
jgi:hypothetical protein